MDNGSVGRPARFQSPMVPMSAKKSVRSRCAVSGMLRSFKSWVNWERKISVKKGRKKGDELN